MRRESGLIFSFKSVLDSPTVWGFFRKVLDFCFGFYRKRIAIMKSFGVTSETSIVDIGCGTGQYSQLTKNTYLGIDRSALYIERANKVYASAKKRFLCADVTEVDLKNSIFDVAIMIDIIHHLSNDKSRRLFRKFNRVATHSVILCEPIKQPPRNLIGRFFTALDRGMFIRSRKDLLGLVSEQFAITKVADLKMMGIQSVCILAMPIHDA